MTRPETIHTFYCPAHRFDAGTLGTLTREAQAFFANCFAEPADLETTFDLPGNLATTVHRRIHQRLQTPPLVTDLRIDFEDGYGPHTAEQEDADAHRVAALAAELWQEKRLPAGFGIRIKAMGSATRSRSERTLDIFFKALLEATGGKVPDGFVVTLAKIEHPREVRQLVEALCRLERELWLEAGTIDIELMAETPVSIFTSDGRLAVLELLAKADGRCIGVHLGVYDFTASVGVVASLQGMQHPICDFARHALLLGLAGTGVQLSDGSSRTVPQLPAGFGPAELERARRDARRVWSDVRHSLSSAIYRGWDLHPSHTVVRLIAVYSFYLEQLADMAERLRSAEAVAGAAILEGGLEDAATLAALRAFFRRGRACGALGDDDCP